MSYQTIVEGYKSPAEAATHETKFGRFNDAPPNWTEISAEDFAQSGFFTWCKVGIEFRQINPATMDTKKLLAPITQFYSYTLFYMNHGLNFAITADYWDKKVRYFTFAVCEHDWKEISAKEAGKPAFNCYHYCKCSKCGDKWEYDSSG